MRNGVLAALCALPLSLPATAAVVTYNDKTLFAAGTGATEVALPASPLVPELAIPGRFTVTPGSSGNLATQYFAGRQKYFLGKSGYENFDFALANGTYAFGFSLFEPTSPAFTNGCNETCVESTFEFTLWSGATKLGTYTVQPPDNVFAFYGYQSSDPITSVTIRETIGWIDNEFFGEFHTFVDTGNPPGEVPLPATVWLLLSGLGALGRIGRTAACASRSGPG